MQKQSISTAAWYILSGMVGGMVVSVVIPQFFIVRQHPLDVLLLCMILGSFVGLIFSCHAKK